MSSRQKAIKSGSWMTFSTIFQTVVQFLQISILARILDPDDFGVVSISTTVIGFFTLFTNFGFFNSIISKQESDRKVLSSIYILGVVVGILIFSLTFISSGLVADFYHEHRLNNVIKLSSCTFLMVYFGSIYSALLQKELKFKSIAIIDIIVYSCGTIITIKLAYDGLKELSLVYGGLFTTLLRTILQILFGRKLFSPLLYFNFKKVKSHLKFGVYNFGEGIVSFIQSNWDNIIIGKMLGTQLLGYYTLAYQLAVFPINKINPIILQVAYPMLAKMKNNIQELKSAYVKILDLVSLFNFPLLAGLFIVSENVVPLIYGPNWEATFPLIKIFVFVSITGCLSHPLFTLAYTKEKPKLLLYLNVVTLLAKIPLVYFLGKYWSVTGIAIAFFIATFINMIFSFIIAYWIIGNFIKEFVSNVYKQIAFCLIMMGTIYLYKHLISFSGWKHTIAQILIGGFIYVILTLKFKYSTADIKQFKINK